MTEKPRGQNVSAFTFIPGIHQASSQDDTIQESLQLQLLCLAILSILFGPAVYSHAVTACANLAQSKKHMKSLTLNLLLRGSCRFTSHHSKEEKSVQPVGDCFHQAHKPAAVAFWNHHSPRTHQLVKACSAIAFLAASSHASSTTPRPGCRAYVWPPCSVLLGFGAFPNPFKSKDSHQINEVPANTVSQLNKP